MKEFAQKHATTFFSLTIILAILSILLGSMLVFHPGRAGFGSRQGFQMQGGSAMQQTRYQGQYNRQYGTQTQSGPTANEQAPAAMDQNATTNAPAAQTPANN